MHATVKAIVFFFQKGPRRSKVNHTVNCRATEGGGASFQGSAQT